MAQMSINTQEVYHAYNTIATYAAEISVLVQNFLKSLEDANTKTQGKFPLVSALVPKIQEEVSNIAKVDEVLESIKDACDKFVALAEEATDANFLK